MIQANSSEEIEYLVLLIEERLSRTPYSADIRQLLNKARSALEKQRRIERRDLPNSYELRDSYNRTRFKLLGILSLTLMFLGSLAIYEFVRNPLNSTQQLKPQIRISNSEEKEFSLAFDRQAVASMKLDSLTLDVIVSNSENPKNINAKVYYEGTWNGEARTPNIEFVATDMDLSADLSNKEKPALIKFFVHAKPKGSNNWLSAEVPLSVGEYREN